MMKKTFHKFIGSLLVAAAVLPGSSLLAGNTWDGGGLTGSWSATSNWNLDTAPTSPTALTFAGSSQLTNTNDLFSAGTIFNGLNFAAGAGAFVIGGNSITLGGTIANSSTSLQTINLDMDLSANRTVTLGAGGGNVVLGGNITGSGAKIDVNGNGSLTLTGSNSHTGGVSLNASTVTLILGNQYAAGSGLISSAAGGTIQASTDLSGANALGNELEGRGNFSITGSQSIEIGAKTYMNTAGSVTMTNNLTAGRTLTLNDVDINTNSTAAYTLTISGTGHTVLAGTVANGNGLRDNILSISNTGTTQLNGDNTYSGGTTLAGGQTIILGHKNAFGTGVVSVTGGGAVLRASTDLTGGNQISNDIGVGNASTFTIAGANSLEIGGTFFYNVANSRTMTNNLDAGRTLILNDVEINRNATAAYTLTLSGSANTIIDGTISNGNGSQANGFTVTNTGTTTINGTNTFTGNASLNTNGVIVLGSKSALGAGNVLINSTSTPTIQASVDLSGADKIANNVTFQNNLNFSGSNNLEIGGKLAVDQANNRTVTNNIVAGKRLILNAVDINQNNSVRSLTISGTGNTSILGTIANGSANANSLIITNTGITTLSGSNTYTGATSVNGGMVVFSNTTAKASATVTANAAGSIGLGVGGAGYYSSANVDSLFAGTLTGFTMNAASGVGIDTSAGDFTYATNQSAARSLTKLGTNKLILTGTNTYSGATIVNEGTLIINGTVGGSGVTVRDGATLGGTGTVNSLVTVQNGATLSPGNSPGVANYNGGLTLQTGSDFTFELIANSDSNRGTDYDGVNVTGGTFTLESDVVFNMVLNGLGSTTDYTGAFWDTAQSWLVFQNTNAPSIAALFDLGVVSNDSLGNSFSVTGGSFSFRLDGNDVYLDYAAIPEPSTWLLLAGGLTYMLVMRRRSR